MDGLAGVGRLAAGKVKKGGVGEGAVEAREDREGELADCRVTADAAKSEET